MMLQSKFQNIIKKRGLFILFLLVGFIFRLMFGLSSEFWFEDEIQIYLIGLMFYTTGNWPFFGPDVVYSQSQIPGALQGILTGGPFYIFSFPEAPYIFLNLLTFASLLFLGYYIGKRISNIPKWFLWSWILTAPWLLNLSTHILNPSYVLPFGIFFFISFLEAIPVFRVGIMKINIAFLLMGIALLAVFQLHMSWVLLVPFIVVAVVFHLKKPVKSGIAAIMYFVFGCFISGILLIPTYIKFGIISGNNSTASNIVFNSNNILELGTVLMRYFSFASFESARFLGSNSDARIAFLEHYLWAAPFIIFAAITGFLQVIWMIVSLFLKYDYKEWKALRFLIITSFLLIWISFFFSIKGPSSHTFYVMLPLIMVYSFYCWKPLLEKKWIKKTAIIFLISGFIFNSCVAYNNYKTKSMYLNREKPLQAIEKKNYHILGERRSYDKNN